MTNFDFDKKLTLASTVVASLPVIWVMLTRINSQNFCKFLALVNFIAYNFGYHVHEKAILMVYVPLLLSAAKAGQADKVRVHLLGVLMVWSFAPLIQGVHEAAIVNLMVAAQCVWLPAFFFEDTTKSDRMPLSKHSFYSKALKLAYVVILVVQVESATRFASRQWTQDHHIQNYIYETVVSIVCAVFNQVIFVDLFIEMVM